MGGKLEIEREMVKIVRISMAKSRIGDEFAAEEDASS